MTTPTAPVTLIVCAVPGVGAHGPMVSALMMERVIAGLERRGWPPGSIRWVDVNPMRDLGVDAWQARVSKAQAPHTRLDAAHAWTTQTAGDVYAYLTHGGRIRRHLMSALTPWRAVPHAVVAVVAHSQGGVVAYDALDEQHEVRPDCLPPLGALVTMGSPLHWRWAGTRPRALHFPRATSATPWLNLRDALDPAATVVELPDLWGQAIADQARDAQICCGVDPHGYWDDRDAADAVVEHLDGLRR